MIRPPVDIFLEIVKKSQVSEVARTGKENPVLKDFETVLHYALGLEIELKAEKGKKLCSCKS